MEVLEEGNLMDRVPILLQRDLEFYQVPKMTAMRALRKNLLTHCFHVLISI